MKDIFPFSYLGLISAAVPSLVSSERDAIVPFAPRGRACGICPCDPFLAAHRINVLASALENQAFGLAARNGRLPHRTGTCIFLCGSRETPVHSQYGSSVREPGRSRSYQLDHEFMETAKGAESQFNTHPFVAILPMDGVPKAPPSEIGPQLTAFAEVVDLTRWRSGRSAARAEDADGRTSFLVVVANVSAAAVAAATN